MRARRRYMMIEHKAVNCLVTRRREIMLDLHEYVCEVMAVKYIGY